MAVARFLARGCQVVGGGTLAASAAFLYWTRECRMYDLADSDVFFHTKSFRQFNPTPAPEGEMRDICIRHCDLRSIRPDIVEDARRGGTALIESLAQGIFGGMGTYSVACLLVPDAKCRKRGVCFLGQIDRTTSN